MLMIDMHIMVIISTFPFNCPQVAADVLRTSVDAPTSIITIPQPFTAGTQCTFSGCYVSMTILSYTGISYAIRPTSCTVGGFAKTHTIPWLPWEIDVIKCHMIWYCTIYI